MLILSQMPIPQTVLSILSYLSISIAIYWKLTNSLNTLHSSQFNRVHLAKNRLRRFQFNNHFIMMNFWGKFRSTSCCLRQKESEMTLMLVTYLKISVTSLRCWWPKRLILLRKSQICHRHIMSSTLIANIRGVYYFWSSWKRYTQVITWCICIHFWSGRIFSKINCSNWIKSVFSQITFDPVLTIYFRENSAGSKVNRHAYASRDYLFQLDQKLDPHVDVPWLSGIGTLFYNFNLKFLKVFISNCCG